MGFVSTHIETWSQPTLMKELLNFGRLELLYDYTKVTKVSFLAAHIVIIMMLKCA